ncbi:GNAT family N-acetyltransferase [Diaphorobacter aerolatus]|uniref:GNAT family N-acetyltransferase n=1 Tax=Diaphorobacter aerolatus TaxID=1288495 RepID=A0A7H0GPX9_9BURK|nr:GNAT family N-acetyltransferase [Diaphorobacter aerolatus]
MPEDSLRSDRVRLRQWTKADFEPFAAMNCDPQVMRYFPALLAREQSDAHASRIRALIAERGWGFWAVDWLQQPGAKPQFVGFVGLHVPIADLPFSPCVEIGWRLARPFWGKGFASEAARLAMNVGFEILQLPQIVAFTARDNLRSRAVMMRLGMRCAAEDNFDHPAVPEGHALRAHCLYRIDRETWRDLPPRQRPEVGAR